MFTLPKEYNTILMKFAPVFSKKIWRLAQVMVIGATLAPGKRTVTAVLRILGLSEEKHFQKYHRVLNRAVWSGLTASQILLGLLVITFAPTGWLTFGIDETIERRWGIKIKARGIYRDPVRSSKSHFVKTSGLRWISMMLLVKVPWAKRVWALPFLTASAPSERYYQEKEREHRKLTDWARYLMMQVRHWLPERSMVVVADSSYAVIDLLWKMCQLANPVYMVTRLRLDAALYKPAPKRKPHQKGRPRKKGERLPKLEQVLNDPATKWKQVIVHNWYGKKRRVVEIASRTAIWYHGGKPPLPIRWVLIRDPEGKFDTQALLCTDLNAKPKQILEWFIMRWQVEVTFQEVRTHLGVETQRQWSDKAIARTTPILLSLFSLVTLLAHKLTKRGNLPVRQAAWYAKSLPTFSDALAIVRRQLWLHLFFGTSNIQDDIQKYPASLQEIFLNAVCYST